MFAYSYTDKIISDTYTSCFKLLCMACKCSMCVEFIHPMCPMSKLSLLNLNPNPKPHPFCPTPTHPHKECGDKRGYTIICIMALSHNMSCIANSIVLLSQPQLLLQQLTTGFYPLPHTSNTSINHPCVWYNHLLGSRMYR